MSIDPLANIVGVIRNVDKTVLEKGSFPIEGCKSLLHTTYHLPEKRSCPHVVPTAYSRSGRFLNARNNPESVLPDETTVVLALTICSDEWKPIGDSE